MNTRGNVIPSLIHRIDKRVRLWLTKYMTAWLTAIGTILISSSVALYLERPNGESPGLSHWLTLSLSLTFFVLAGIKAWRDDVSKNRTSRDGVSKNFMGKGSARTGKGGSRAGKI